MRGMRLIDADKVKFKFPYGIDHNGILMVPYNSGKCSLDNAPAVDAVPVVRCRECRYYAASGATTSFCIHPGGMKFTSDSDYCSRGQRRDQSADVRNMGQFAGGGKMDGGSNERPKKWENWEDLDDTGFYKRIDRQYKATVAFAKVFFPLCAVLLLLFLVRATWIYVDKLSWVRFVLALPCPGWLRAWLLGWR